MSKEHYREPGYAERTKLEVLRYLEECRGTITWACKKADINRSTFYEWCKEDPDFAKKCAEIDDLVIDKVKVKVHELVEQTDNLNVALGACKYIINTKGFKVRENAEVQKVIVTTTDEVDLDVIDRYVGQEKLRRRSQEDDECIKEL